MRSDHPPLRAVLLLVGACVAFALLDSLAKLLSQTHHPLLVSWARYVFHVLVMAAIFAPRMGRAIVRTRSPWLQAARGACLALSTGLFFASLTYLPQAEATAIVSIVPILTTVGAVRLMGERAPRGTGFALVASFAGVLLIVRPGTALFGWGAVLPLLAALFMVGYQLLTRRLASLDNGLATLFIGALVAAALLTVFAPARWQLPDGPGQALLFVSTGVVGALGHLLLVRAYERGSAAGLAPYNYMHAVMAAAFGWLFFRQFPDLLSLFGMTLIVATGVVMAALRRIDARPLEE